MRVLVVEDDSSIRETLGLVLETFGHQPILVDHGEKALTYLQENWPDLMLLDLTLPEMSGDEVYEKILAGHGRTPPTIVLSASNQGATRARNLPQAWFLSKPYTLDQLTEMMEVAVFPSGAA